MEEIDEMTKGMQISVDRPFSETIFRRFRAFLSGLLFFFTRDEIAFFLFGGVYSHFRDRSRILL